MDITHLLTISRGSMRGDRSTDMAEKKYYAVAAGRNPGIYTQWFGDAGAQAQVKGFQGARYKGFPTIEEARAFIRERPDIKIGAGRAKKKRQAAIIQDYPGAGGFHRRSNGHLH
jgi:hypothetical protein